MAFVNFVKSKTQAQSLADSATNPGKVYFPTDTTNIIMGGKKYGSVAETAINLNVTALKQGDDLNNITTSGLYGTGMTVVCNSLLNKPGIPFGECVLSVGQGSGSAYVVQRLFTLNTGVWQERTRMKRAGEGFSPWVQTADSNIPITSLAPKDSPVFSGRALFTGISTEHIETKGLVASLVASSSGESVVEFKEDGSAKFESEVIYKGQFLDQRFEKKKKLKWMNVIGKSYPYGTAMPYARYFWKDGLVRIKFSTETLQQEGIEETILEGIDRDREAYARVILDDPQRGQGRYIQIDRNTIGGIIHNLVEIAEDTEFPAIILSFYYADQGLSEFTYAVCNSNEPRRLPSIAIWGAPVGSVMETSTPYVKLTRDSNADRVLCDYPLRMKVAAVTKGGRIFRVPTYQYVIDEKRINKLAHRRSEVYRAEEDFICKYPEMKVLRYREGKNRAHKTKRMKFAPIFRKAIYKNRWLSEKEYIIYPTVETEKYIIEQLFEDNYDEYTSSNASYTITVQPNNSEAGTVSGSGEYKKGEEVTISAEAKEGYVFQCWDDYDSNAERTITVEGNKVYTAIFVEE